MSEPVKIGLLRHARTRWNREHRIQGRQDSPLTEKGKARARQWGRELSGHEFSRILSSPQPRALSTANLVNETLCLPVETGEGLVEQDWGRWTGRSLAELQEQEAETLETLVRSGWNFAAPGGETREAVWERASRSLLSAAARYPGQTLLVVTHEGVIRCLVYRLMGRSYLPGEPRVFRGRALHWLEGDGNGLKLVKANALPLED